MVTGTIRRKPNLDFRSANAAELEGIKDPEVPAIAARDGRLLRMIAKPCLLSSVNSFLRKPVPAF